MNKLTTIRPEFVEFIPERLDEGVLYISIPYTTATHLCACGCGQEVVTPLSPLDWRMILDGETVSLKPSIGNWSFDCQSHYWIERDRIRWARRFSRTEIDAGRERDRRAKAGVLQIRETAPDVDVAHRNVLRRLFDRFFS